MVVDMSTLWLAHLVILSAGTNHPPTIVSVQLLLRLAEQSSDNLQEIDEETLDDDLL